jgi:hypothetical protein
MSPPEGQRQTADNRRKFPRRPMLKNGTIHLGPGYTLPCLVLNVSDGGAKIKTQSVASCPDRFGIEIGGEPARPCRVAWRAGELIGVEYVAESDPVAATAAVAAPIGAGKDRRAHKRNPMLRPASIVFKGGFASVRCNVLDLSAGGARIKPIDPASCPTHFELRIDDGPSHKCEIVRSERGIFGVRFTDVPAKR